MSTTSFQGSKLDGFVESMEHDREAAQCGGIRLVAVNFVNLNLLLPDTVGVAGFQPTYTVNGGVVVTNKQAVLKFIDVTPPKDLKHFNKIGRFSYYFSISNVTGNAFPAILKDVKFNICIGIINADFTLATVTANTLEPLIEWTDTQPWNLKCSSVAEGEDAHGATAGVAGSGHMFIDTIFSETPAYGIVIKIIPEPLDYAFPNTHNVGVLISTANSFIDTDKLVII